MEELVHNPLWNELRARLERSCGVRPYIGHSLCSAAPGWNVKFQKSGRALCTLYPRNGYDIALITVGKAEAAKTELALPLVTDQIRERYRRTTPMNNARRLMIQATDAITLADVKRLIGLRFAPCG